jgi:hypothetical protein
VSRIIARLEASILKATSLPSSALQRIEATCA